MTEYWQVLIESTTLGGTSSRTGKRCPRSLRHARNAVEQGFSDSVVGRKTTACMIPFACGNHPHASAPQPCGSGATKATGHHPCPAHRHSHHTQYSYKGCLLNRVLPPYLQSYCNNSLASDDRIIWLRNTSSSCSSLSTVIWCASLYSASGINRNMSNVARVLCVLWTNIMQRSHR